jgi:putative peptide zinc metalloprotease protein
MWVERGRYLGSIVGGSRFRFAAVVPQEEASELFRAPVAHIEVKLWGEAFRSIRTESVTLVPYQHEKLPSAALGQQAGGSVAVVQNSRQEADNAAEPFFLINALLEEQSGVHLLHGRSGTIRMSLSPEPLLVQWSRRIYQLFQKRYQVS